MPHEDVEKFIASVVVDKEIIDQLVGYAAERGYEFSALDLQKYLAREMSEADLESVSGGTGAYDPRIFFDSVAATKKKKPAKK